VSLGTLLPRVVGLHLRGSAVRGRIDADPDLPLVHGDAEELHRVFANVVRNARQALTDRGTLTLRVVAAPGVDGRAGVRVDLRDDGPGVPVELARGVFSSGVSGRPGGQGLGLASCRHVLTRMGGTIDLERAGGPGACFRVWLPVARGPAAPLG
jgi:signal transduction histidine kinase